MKFLIEGFEDYLSARHRESDVQFASRPWQPTPAYLQTQDSDASSIKKVVLLSRRLNQVMKQISEEENVSHEVLQLRVKEFLEEIGYSREEPIIRWSCYFTLKLLKNLYTSIYVNEAFVFKLKAQMGRRPMVFIPTHRSYADFILTSILCFSYDIELPRIAAGMDFQNMAVIGQILRDCCAFFMRRTFSDDKLYSATFSEYVHALVTHGEAPLEFFIEGTRSRTGKALVPKFGLLTMMLKPFLTGLVHDISIVPVNISYERILEEVLFAYELLGIPKPKESTRGFIKALSILGEDYGKVFINFGEPVSVKEYMNKKVDHMAHVFGPAELQDLTRNETQQISGFAYHIVNRQKALTVLSCSNVMFSILTNHLLSKSEACTISFLAEEVTWLADVLEKFGAVVNITDDTRSCVQMSLRWHYNLVYQNDEEVGLLLTFSHGPQTPHSKNKGANLSPDTMDCAIPYLLLQSYVNPAMHYFAQGSAVVIILKSLKKLERVTRTKVFEDFITFRKIFAHEFTYYWEDENDDFTNSIKNLELLQVVSNVEDCISLGQNTKLQTFLVNIIGAFLPAYAALSHILLDNSTVYTVESELLKRTQSLIETRLNGNIAHPGNLSLDVLSNGLHSFTALGALFKKRSNGSVTYSTNMELMEIISNKLDIWEKEIPRIILHKPVLSSTSKL